MGSCKSKHESIKWAENVRFYFFIFRSVGIRYLGGLQEQVSIVDLRILVKEMQTMV